MPHTLRYTLGDDPAAADTLKPRQLRIGATSPVGIVRYRLDLHPGQKVTLEWKLPVLPVAPGSREDAAVRAADYDDTLAKTVAVWDKIRS